jgi:hypothetical protein
VTSHSLFSCLDFLIISVVLPSSLFDLFKVKHRRYGLMAVCMGIPWRCFSFSLGFGLFDVDKDLIYTTFLFVFFLFLSVSIFVLWMVVVMQIPTF